MRKLKRGASDRKHAGLVSGLLSLALIGLGFCPLAVARPAAGSIKFEVTWPRASSSPPRDGRLFVILARKNQPEPRFLLGETAQDAPLVLARDLAAFAPGDTAMLDSSSFIFPSTNSLVMFRGEYFLQAVFDFNTDLRSPHAPHNLHTTVRKLDANSTGPNAVQLQLTEQIPAEDLPQETEYLKFVRIPSHLLTKFHGRPIFLRAGVVLPRDFRRDSKRQYPLWIQIGGLNTRYSSVIKLMSAGEAFRKTWLADSTPRLVLLQLDGAGPNGDPYQINSDNNGPYGDALVQELIPFVESNYRAVGLPRARVLSGTSTGGWVCLALQVFYPEFFNGAWSSCPDPVDFRALELINIYEDQNAYVDQQGQERLSKRNVDGEFSLTMRREVSVENLLGRGDSYTRSGQQWGEWNAAFSPRGPNGLPVPLWDPKTGKLDRAVAEHWERYDLSLVLKQNWNSLAPKLRNKIHIAAGEADQYFLNHAVHLLERRMSESNPPFDAKIVYGAGKGHGWMDLTLEQMLEEMDAATRTGPRTTN